MTNVIKAGKRAFSVGVVGATIAWSMGASALLVPLTAHAVTVAPGTVFKASGASATYYMGSDGKRYIFANEAIYFSWYRDFAGVQTVTSADVLGVPIGGNVKVRAGTKLVQFVAESADKKKFIVVDAKVYAVEPMGLLRHLASPAVASGLFGAQWEKRITPMLETYFGEYTFGAAVDGATSVPSGFLAKQTGSTEVFHVDGMIKHAVSSSALIANNWASADVLTVASLAAYTAGDPITGVVASLVDPSQKGGAGAPAAGAAGALSVALDPGSPAAGSVIADSTGGGTSGRVGQRATFLKFTLTAAAGAGDVKVTQVKLHRLGVSSDSDFDFMYLFEGNTRLADAQSFASGVATYNNASGIVTVPAGSTKVISVVGDIANATSSGKTMGFSVAGSDVTSNATSASGSAVGNLFTVATVADAGQLQVRNISPTASQTVDSGQTNYELWRFGLIANSQNIRVTSMTVTQTGSIASSDIQNFKIMDGDVQLGATIPSLSNNKLVFDLTGMTDGGYKISSGQTRQIALRGDIIGGTNRTYVFTFQQSTDLIAWDLNYNVQTATASYVFAADATYGGQNAFTVVGGTSGANGATAISTTIGTGRLVLSVSSNSPQGNVPSNGTNVELGRFDFRATGEDVKVTSLPVCGVGSSTTSVLRNVKLVFGGAQVGTTATTMTAGSTGACTGGTAATTYSFGNTFIAPAGTTTQLVVSGDLTDSTIATGQTFQMALGAGSSNASGRVSLQSISSTGIAARTLTVRSGAVTVVKNVSVSDHTASTPTGVTGTQGAVIGSFIITGGGEASNVTQMVMTANGVNLDSRYQNLRLMHGSTQLGTTVASLSTGTAATNSFTPSPAVRVEASGTYQVDVVADVKSGATTGAFVGVTLAGGPVVVDSVAATGANTSADTSYSTDVSLQNNFVSSAGALVVDIGPDTPVNVNIVMAATDQVLGHFKLSASSTEAVNITRLVVGDVLTDSATTALAATGTLRNIRIFDSAAPTVELGRVTAFDNTNNTGTAVAVFDNLSLVVPKSGTKTILVKADVSRHIDGGVSSSTHRMRLIGGGAGAADDTTEDYDYLTSGVQNSVLAYGRDSGSTLTTSGNTLRYAGGGNINGNYFDVFRTKITVAVAADAPSGLGTGAPEQLVGKFVITNSANDPEGSYDATVNRIGFRFASTISNTASRGVKVYKDAFIANNQIAATTTVCANAGNTICAYGNVLFDDGASTITAPVAAGAGFVDLVIGAGTSKSIFVTADTTDAVAARAFSVNLDANRIFWTDGVTSNITKVDGLPITGRGLSY